MNTGIATFLSVAAAAAAAEAAWSASAALRERYGNNRTAYLEHAMEAASSTAGRPDLPALNSIYNPTVIA